jgi:hypothetical protein
MSTEQTVRYLMRAANPLPPAAFSDYVDSGHYQQVVADLHSAGAESAPGSNVARPNGPREADEIEVEPRPNRGRFGQRRWAPALIAACVLLIGAAVSLTVIGSSRHEPAASSASVAVSKSAPPPDTPWARQQAQLWETALVQANESGEIHMTSADAVKTTKEKALSLMGDLPHASADASRLPVWLIQIDGAFRCTSGACPAAPGSLAAQGDTIQALYGENAVTLIAVAYPTRSLDLTRLGTPVHLGPQSGSGPSSAASPLAGTTTSTQS